MRRELWSKRFCSCRVSAINIRRHRVGVPASAAKESLVPHLSDPLFFAQSTSTSTHRAPHHIVNNFEASTVDIQHIRSSSRSDKRYRKWSVEGQLLIFRVVLATFRHRDSNQQHSPQISLNFDLHQKTEANRVEESCDKTPFVLTRAFDSSLLLITHHSTSVLYQPQQTLLPTHQR